MRRPITTLPPLLLFLVFLCRGQRSNSDSDRPSCHRCDLTFSCNCSHAQFIVVPMVTDDALTLDLSFNNIVMVTDDDLKGHARLRVLSLHANRLSEIHSSAFASLWSLEELDLSDNEIKIINHKWFRKLGALQRLNLLHNPYRSLGPHPLFKSLVQLRRLSFGSDALEEIGRAHVSGIDQLEELRVHGDNLRRYEPGALADIWPLGHVYLSLHGPFLNNQSLASAMLGDVSYPETWVILENLHLATSQSLQPFREAAKKRIRYLSLHNVSISDQRVVEFLVVTDGVPLTFLKFDGVTLKGEGRWEKAYQTDHKALDEVYLRNVIVLDVYKFVSFLQLGFLLQYPRKVSVINAGVFVMPCATSYLLVNLQYLDLSDNLLTDLTLQETLCNGRGTLKDLRVLNISGNALKSLSTVSQLVTKLSKLTHLDISRNGYSWMPQSCPWPPTLRYLNISQAKLNTVTPCLPVTLQVLDLSNNNLNSFLLVLPALTELYLSGNKFLMLPLGWMFPNLQILNIQSNTLTMFSLSDLASYSRLKDLQAGQNKFDCNCDFVNFFQSDIQRRKVMHLSDGEDTYLCDSPLYLQGRAVGRVWLSIVDCHRVLFVSVSCGLALIVGVMVCILLWRLHAFWYLKMMWAWLKAKRGSQRRRRIRHETEPLLSFDAFISYSERDASWVENFLVPELEEPSQFTETQQNPPGSLSLCLHKRDFLPGQWIVDNIISAIERSRRTVFILSENFLQSDWCRYELDFSHFQLFDGHTDRDAVILILLEPLSRDDIPKRFCKLRKLMGSTTYLEWPQDDDRRAEFWNNLRKALNGRDG
uniref:Toll-like receptor 2 n=1 Tax=Sphaeramia orbicularis TaxID=375764 RepID=A0A672YL23_9TELE